ADLAELAVVDDVDAGFALSLHDLRYRLREPRLEARRDDGLALLVGPDHVREVFRARKASRVGGQDLVRNLGHGLPPSPRCLSARRSARATSIRACLTVARSTSMPLSSNIPIPSLAAL